MLMKYSGLINDLLEMPTAEVIKTTPDSIDISARTEYFTFRFTIVHAFTEVKILWMANGPLGNLSEKWTFPSHMDQTAMAEKMASDIEFKINNFGDFNEFEKRFNKAVDEVKMKDKDLDDLRF
jgi:hypothetical protein